jgi:hypothetical protein
MRMRRPSGWRSSEAGFLVLIEILVAVVIIAMLASYYLTGSGTVAGRGGSGSGLSPNVEGEPTSIPGKARDEAESVVCRNNLGQVRAAIANYQATNGTFPPDLPSLQVGVPLTCPVGGEPYQYDPNTGQVNCTHRHHEGY